MNHKLISLLFPIILLFSSLHAQDLIILLRGDTISTSITKITDSRIIYRCVQNSDSACSLSNTLVRKIIYAGGTEKIVEHLKKLKESGNLLDSTLLIVRGNTYYFKGNKINHQDLEKIYFPLHDSLLNAEYFKGINLKMSSGILKYMPIPLGVIGYGFFIYGSFPTNNIFSQDPQYGHDGFVLPGLVLMGAALISGIGGIITHHGYKKILKNSALHYNILIAKQQLH